MGPWLGLLNACVNASFIFSIRKKIMRLEGLKLYSTHQLVTQTQPYAAILSLNTRISWIYIKGLYSIMIWSCTPVPLSFTALDSVTYPDPSHRSIFLHKLITIIVLKGTYA